MTAPTLRPVELTGEIVRPSDADYQVACAGWNLLFAHEPMVMGLLEVQLTPFLWDDVPQEGCRCAQEVPAGVQA